MDSLTMTRKLISFDTSNPPGNEKPCAGFVAGFLQDLGFDVRSYEFEPGRPTLIARIPGASQARSICFTGHLDVVPAGAVPWSANPFSGETQGDKLFGRGSSDMKSGVAAMLMTAKAVSTQPALLKRILFVFTSGEETCSQGAYHVAGLNNVLGETGAIVVGEPTGNIPVIGHKGCIRFNLTFKGKAAHASMPELGENAVYKAARAIRNLESFDFSIPPHPLLGGPTLVVSRIHGGININSVPDQAVTTLDIRTIPGQDYSRISDSLAQLLGPDAAITRLESVNPIATDPLDPWIQSVYGIMETILGVPVSDQSVTYFTDASVLKPAYREPPCVILGPGEAAQAHRTDEFCYISKIDQAADAYIRIIERGI